MSEREKDLWASLYVSGRVGEKKACGHSLHVSGRVGEKKTYGHSLHVGGRKKERVDRLNLDDGGQDDEHYTWGKY